MMTLMSSSGRGSWPRISVLLFSLCLLFSSESLGLHVVPGSNCTAVCSSNVTSSNTAVGEIVCNDGDYNNTNVGKSFQSCISCELESQTFDHQSKQTDLGWALCKPCN